MLMTLTSFETDSDSEFDTDTVLTKLCQHSLQHLSSSYPVLMLTVSNHDIDANSL